MSKYIIINKEEIEKKIEQLKIPIAHYDGIYISSEQIREREALEDILAGSTSLIPEIEKAYEAGKLDKELSLTFDNPKGRYISSLKLNI